MIPPTVSSTGVQPLAVVLSETQRQAPGKDGVADDLLNVRQVNHSQDGGGPNYMPAPVPYYPPIYDYQPPPYSYQPPPYSHASYTPDYSYTPQYTPQYPSYQSPTPDNANVLHQGYGHSSQRDPNGLPNDLSQPGGAPADRAPGGLLARMFPNRGNQQPGVSRWTGVVGSRDSKPVTANLSLVVDGTAAVQFQISSNGAGANRFRSDEQTYWNALGFQNIERK